MPAVIRIPMRTVEALLDMPEGVRVQEARIIDDHLEILAEGDWRDPEGGMNRLRDGVWYAALYAEAQPGVLVLLTFAGIPGDD